MTRDGKKAAVAGITYSPVELDGVQYAIVRTNVLRALCRRASVRLEPSAADMNAASAGPLDINLDRTDLARRLIARRTRAGLTQVELARRAGVRVETLNRIERGRTTPDFATVRKLVVAMNEAERVGPEEASHVDNDLA
jgi:DNA-binding XRE family transcriptional regulator